MRSDPPRSDATSHPAPTAPARAKNADNDPATAQSDAAPPDAKNAGDEKAGSDSEAGTVPETAAKPFVTALAEDLAPKTTESDVTPEPVDAAAPAAPNVPLPVVAAIPPSTPPVDNGPAAIGDDAEIPPAATVPSSTSAPRISVDSALPGSDAEFSEPSSAAHNETTVPTQNAGPSEPDQTPETTVAPQELRTDADKKPERPSRAGPEGVEARIVNSEDGPGGDAPASSASSSTPEKTDRKGRSASLPGAVRQAATPAAQDQPAAATGPATNEKAESAPANVPPHANAAHASRQPHEPNLKETADTARAPSSEPPQQASPSNLTGIEAPARITVSSLSPAGTTAPTPDIQQNATTATFPIAGIAVEIATRAQAGHRQFDIRLDPPELGRIDVRLDVDNGGNVTSRLVVERAETLDLLRREAPHLERALQDAGLKSGDNALQFSLRDQGGGAQGQNQSDAPLRNAARLLVSDDQTVPSDLARNYLRLLGRPGGVDIRV
jgi:chemotaxis protein MotD